MLVRAMLVTRGQRALTDEQTATAHGRTPSEPQPEVMAVGSRDTVVRMSPVAVAEKRGDSMAGERKEKECLVMPRLSGAEQPVFCS